LPFEEVNYEWCFVSPFQDVDLHLLRIDNVAVLKLLLKLQPDFFLVGLHRFQGARGQDDRPRSFLLYLFKRQRRLHAPECHLDDFLTRELLALLHDDIVIHDVIHDHCVEVI